jgi:hypothetical protein
VQTDTVTAKFRMYTTGVTTYIGLTIHRYFQLRYYFITSGSFTAGNWYIVNQIGGLPVGSNVETAVVSGSASLSDPGRFTFGGSAGTYVEHTIQYTLSGTNPSTTGFTPTLIVNGTPISYPLNFTTTYGSGNLYPVGWSLEGNSVGTAGSQTGITLSQFNGDTGSAPATGASIAGPAVTGVGLVTPTDYSVRSLVGGTDAGVFILSLSPGGATLGSSATFTLSDDAATGTFGGANVSGSVLTLTAGTTSSTFTYTGNASGTRTITAVGGGAASGFSNATFQTVVSPNVIIIDGDSRSDYRSGNTTTSVASSNIFVWPVLLQQRLGTTAAIYDVAASGQTVGDELADQATEVIARITAALAAGGNVKVVQWGAGNGINARSLSNPSDTPSQVGDFIEGQINTYCAACINAGADVIVVTDARRADAGAGFALWQNAHDQTNFNLAIDQINTKIRANWDTYATGIFDWGNDNRCLNPTVSSSIFIDGTHFNPFSTSTVDTSHVKAAGPTDFAEATFALYRGVMLGMGLGGVGAGGAGALFRRRRR